MKKSIITFVLSLLALVCTTQSKAQMVTRSMFPAAEMAGEITEQLDRQLDFSNSQFDNIYYFYLDWINDVLDEMEYYGTFPMTMMQYDHFCDNGFGYFFDDDNTFGARKSYFRRILTRRQYYRWLALEDRGRSTTTTVFIYPYGFPRFTHYDPHVHVHYIWSRPPRPHGYHRHDYHPHPRHEGSHHHTGHNVGHQGHHGNDHGRPGHNQGNRPHNDDHKNDRPNDNGTTHRGSFGSSGGVRDNGNGGIRDNGSGRGGNDRGGIRDNGGRKHNDRGTTPSGGHEKSITKKGMNGGTATSGGTTRRKSDRMSTGSTSKKGTVSTTPNSEKKSTTTVSSRKRNSSSASSGHRKSSDGNGRSGDSDKSSSKRGGGSSEHRSRR